MGKQEFIDLCNDAIEKLKRQGEPSIDNEGHCAYDTAVGCCIVGHMMPDAKTRIAADNYTDTVNGISSSISDLESYGFEWAQQFNTNQIETLGELQMYHDEAETPLGLVNALSEMRNTVTRYEEAA